MRHLQLLSHVLVEIDVAIGDADMARGRFPRVGIILRVAAVAVAVAAAIRGR
jgi:hypothetical protein